MCWEWSCEGHDSLVTRSVLSIFAAALRHRPIQLHVRLPRLTALLSGCGESKKPHWRLAKTVTRQDGEGEEEIHPVDSVVRPEGLEPPTPRSVVWCSIH